MGVWSALPLIDIESIGAGGGSVGWVDSRGMLRVGPRSSGSEPGPACYGKGGTEPTVTDALVVLGYIDPTMFLGGTMALDVDAAHRACEAVGRAAGLGTTEAAWGIREISLEGMVKATRALLNARGLDGADQALISFGGCGSLFTPDIARAIRATRVLVPELASVLSAFGAATADIRRERLHSLSIDLTDDPGPLQALADKLQTEVLEDLAADGVAPGDRSVLFEADLRFKRQAWEVTIPLRSGPITADVLSALGEDFRHEYARRYGAGSMVIAAGTELVTLRATGIGRTEGASAEALRREPVAAGTVAGPTGARRVQLGRHDGDRRDVPSYTGTALQPGHVVAGPALVDGPDTTIWIPPDATARLDDRSTLVLEVHP